MFSVTTKHTDYWYTHAIRSMSFCPFEDEQSRQGRILCDGKTTGTETPPTNPLLSQVHDWLLSSCCHTDWERHWQLVMLMFVYKLRLAACVCLCLGVGWWNEVMNSWNFYHPQRVHGSVCCMINTVSPTTDRQLSGSCPTQSGSLSIKLSLWWAFRGVTWQVGLCHIGCSLDHIITSPLHTKLSLFPM